CRVAPSTGLYEEPRCRGDVFGVWTEILASDQVFLHRFKKNIREIDYGCAAQIDLERRFFDRRPIYLKMKPSIGVRAVVHAHPDRAEIHARAFCDLICNTITKRFVTGPFGKVI